MAVARRVAGVRAVGGEHSTIRYGRRVLVVARMPVDDAGIIGLIPSLS